MATDSRTLPLPVGLAPTPRLAPGARPAPARRSAAPAAASPASASLRPLRRLFWVACVGLAILLAVKSWGQMSESVIGALLIIVAALTPSFLWVTGRVRGLPLFPVSSLPCIWAFALPLVSDHPIVELFPGRYQMAAALSVTGYLAVGTLAWYFVARRPVHPPRVCWMMNEEKFVPVLLGTLGVSVVWTVVNTAGWIVLSSGLSSIATAISLAAEALATFVLSYQMGSRTLTGGARATFLCVLGALLFSKLPGLLLIVAMSLSGIALMAYVTASKRLPWRVGLAALFVCGFLHVGKSEMREKYWHDDETVTTISPSQYPGFLAEWVHTSWTVLRRGDTSDEHEASLLERASLMHWLLYIQANTPAAIPFMDGATYAVIPRLFVPRILDPDKPRSHEATYMLAIQYGLQTREDTEITTIAFGLLSEAYANFGFLGMGALGALLGTFYAYAARWARGMPILSFRALFAILVASYSFQVEYTSTVYVTALFQSTVVLLLASVVFMRMRQVNSTRAVLLD